VARLRWVSAAVSRDQLMLVAIGVTLFIALPWRFVMWRPDEMPATWVQPAFAGAKLALIYVSITIGWGICLLAGARSASTPKLRLAGRSSERLNESVVSDELRGVSTPVDGIRTVLGARPAGDSPLNAHSSLLTGSQLSWQCGTALQRCLHSPDGPARLRPVRQARRAKAEGLCHTPPK